MPLHDVRSVHLPYVIDRLEDGRYVVLNREYKPIGFQTSSWIDYETYPIAVRFTRMTKATARRLSFEGSEDLNSIALYNDGCVPTASAAHMKAYLKRLSILANLALVGSG